MGDVLKQVITVKFRLQRETGHNGDEDIVDVDATAP
jgi:hypothetical protein